MNDPLKKYRKRLRAWLAKRRLARELAHYESLFQSRSLCIPDDMVIRQSIQSRFPHLRPKPKGKLNILALYYHHNWENDSLRPSLAKFGYVRHYDWTEEFDHRGREREWHKSIKSLMNDDLIVRVKKWVAEDSTDVIFTYLSGEFVSPTTARELSSIGIPMVNLSLNDKEGFVGKIRNGQVTGQRDICRFFSACWTSTYDALKKYCVEEGIPVYLPEGANPEVHRPYPVERDIDVSFIGQCYGNRPQVINGLRERGIDVEAYGYGWPKGPLSTDDMVRMYSRSKINLGFGGVAGHKDTYCLKGRDFEIPMSRGLYLTEYNRELERFYNLGEEIVTYSGFEDLMFKINDLLSSSEKSEAIRQKGHERARKEHTWEKRFDKIFRLIGLVDDEAEKTQSFRSSASVN